MMNIINGLYNGYLNQCIRTAKKQFYHNNLANIEWYLKDMKHIKRNHK